MKPYPFLTLNHFTVPQTVAMTFLSPLAGTANVRPPGPPLPAPLPVRPGSVSAALRAGAAGGCWVSLLVAGVMVTGAGGWQLRLLPGWDGNKASCGGGAAQGLAGVLLFKFK